MGRFDKIRNDYRKSLKSQDTEETLDLLFYRPVGYLWARLARRLGISPNTITIASIFLGIGAGIMFYFPDFWMNVMGVILLVWANSFDSADGQLARMTKQYSTFGRILDGLSGDLWFIAIYVALCLRMSVTESIFSEHEWAVWVLAILAGGCHAKQAAMADYYRQFHLYFVKGPENSEFLTVDRLDEDLKKMSWKGNFFKKLTSSLYRHYTANQEVMTPNMQRLRRLIEHKFGANLPVSFRTEFRQASRPLMKYTNMLTFNTRAIVLFISVLSGFPYMYFVFELTVLNLMLIYMLFRHERICRKFYGKISNGDYND